MADWKTLSDPKLKSDFEKVGPNPLTALKAREKFVKSLETAKAQFASPTPTKGFKTWKVNNGVVEFKPSVGRNAIQLGGASTHYIPEERFGSFVDAVIASVKAGELDQEIQNPLSASVVALSKALNSGKSSGEKKTRNVSEESRLNIRVGGFRRGGKSDAEITKLLKAEGVEDAKIKAAIAYKRAK